MKSFTSIFRGLCGSVLLTLCLVAAAHADIITFDDPGVTAGSNLAGIETYQLMGVYFLPHADDPTGTVMAAGEFGLDNGTNFAACTSPTTFSGLRIEFENPIDSFSIDYALGAGSTIESGENIYFQVAGYPLPQQFGAPGEWETMEITGMGTFDSVTIYYDAGGNAPNVGFDNLVFTTVPVPAAVLLFGSGLVPVFLRRRK
jgi:hypothetical protein